MKLDRNINGDGRGKYGLILNRKLAEITNHDGSGRAANKLAAVREAIAALEAHGVIDWGDTVDTEFFVIRLRDRYACATLHEYAIGAVVDDSEYAKEVRMLADRSGFRHPHPQVPD